MTSELNHAGIPTSIRGRQTEKAGSYGESANRAYRASLKQAEDEFVRTGNAQALEAVNKASVRYAPKGAIAKSNITRVGLENAVGYAKADIAVNDKDGDGAINLDELKHACHESCGHQLDKLNEILTSDTASDAEKQDAAEHAALIVQTTVLSAANLMASVDVNGDEKITADEMAAKILFDDTALQMFEDNAEQYRFLIDALQAQSDYGGPSFEDLKARVEFIRAANPKQMKLDGKITGGEREIADALTAAPVATNEIVKAIHGALDLESVAQSLP